MKKIVYLSLTSLAIICLMLLVSCNETENITHNHTFGEWNVTKEASCLEDGSRTRACQCGESETETIPAAGHTEETVVGTPATCTENGITNGKKCSVCGETTVNQEEIPAFNHAYKYTEETDENGNINIVASCQRNVCNSIIKNLSGLYDAENNLLASWDELVNVYGLSYEFNSFSSFNKLLQENENLACGTTLIIDNSVTKISGYSFRECHSLTRIIIPSNITSIEHNAFYNCSSLKNISVDQNNEYYKSIDGNLYSKDGKTLVKYAMGKDDKTFSIPNEVTQIGLLSISFCKMLENVVIPDSVTIIGNSAFYYCASLENIYFTGTAEQWNDIKNVRLWLPNNALVHYDSKKMFMAQGFAGDFGSSGAAGFIQTITTDDTELYINNALYGTINCVDSYEFEYDKYVYSYIETLKELDKLEVLDQIQNCKKFYILEGVDQNDSPQTRICCYIDGVFYLLTVSDINEETGTPIVNRINYSIINWED